MLLIVRRIWVVQSRISFRVCHTHHLCFASFLGLFCLFQPLKLYPIAVAIDYSESGHLSRTGLWRVLARLIFNGKLRQTPGSFRSSGRRHCRARQLRVAKISFLFDLRLKEKTMLGRAHNFPLHIVYGSGPTITAMFAALW